MLYYHSSLLVFEVEDKCILMFQRVFQTIVSYDLCLNDLEFLAIGKDFKRFVETPNLRHVRMQATIDTNGAV